MGLAVCATLLRYADITDSLEIYQDALKTKLEGNSQNKRLRLNLSDFLSFSDFILKLSSFL
jgi:hypothetical protein